MKPGDIVYYRGHAVTVIRKARPVVFGYLAKKNYVYVRVSAETAAAWGKEHDTKRNVRVYAVDPNELSHDKL